jgi:hypothetical protein
VRHDVIRRCPLADDPRVSSVFQVDRLLVAMPFFVAFRDGKRLCKVGNDTCISERANKVWTQKSPLPLKKKNTPCSQRVALNIKGTFLCLGPVRTHPKNLSLNWTEAYRHLRTRPTQTPGGGEFRLSEVRNTILYMQLGVVVHAIKYRVFIFASAISNGVCIE